MQSEHKRKNAIYRKILTVNDDFKLFNDDKNYNSAKPLNKKPIIKIKTSDFTKDYLNENLIINENLKTDKEKEGNQINIFRNSNINLNIANDVRNSLRGKNNKKIKSTFLANELILPLSNSFKNDLENYKYYEYFFDKKEGNKKKDKRNKSFSFKDKKDKQENNLLVRSVTLMKQIESKYNNLSNEKNKDPTFIDEKEIIDHNIQFLKGKNENLEINMYEGTKDKNNISYISINLFIKKVAMDNLRTKYSLLYRSFIHQYNIFLSNEIFIEKIINAFYYYKNTTSIEYPELINLLNIIILNNYNLIRNNNNLISKLKTFYKNIKDAEFLKDFLKEDTLNVYYILFNQNDEYDLNFAKLSLSKKRENNIKFFGQFKKKKNKSIGNKNNKNLLDNIFTRKSFFYIFDYSEQEIAIKLTTISYKLMSDISMYELLNSNFSKKDRTSRAPNVMKVIQRFDKLNLFIIEDICSYDKPKKRAEAITKWIKIALQCKNLYNFNDTLVINTCFSNYLMKKLSLTWKQVPKSTILILNYLRQFCSNNQCYINIRREMVNRKGRFYVPYLGILLKEIINLEEKYKYILDKGNINCCKIQKLYILINDFFHFKNNPLTKVNIYNLDVLENLSPKNEEQIELVITKIEPKLFISAGNELKRKTKTDYIYYMNQ